MKNKVVIAENEAATAEEPNPKGIPEFWFTIFRNVDMLSELVQVSASAPREMSLKTVGELLNWGLAAFCCGWKGAFCDPPLR